MLSLAVIVINYRTADMTIECAETVLAQLPREGLLVVVDNASGDGSGERLSAWAAGRDGVRLVLSPVNGGFSSGNNRGIEAAGPAERYLFLNSDAFPRPGALAAMMARADAAPDAGLIHPVLIDPDGTVQISRFRAFRPSTELVRGSGLDAVARRLPRGVVAIPVGADEAPEWVSFACVMVTRAALAAAGPMDEGYFMYFEDVEYAGRVLDAGFAIAQAEDALVEHRRGGSSPVKALSKAAKRLPRYYYESRSRYYRERYGRLGFVAANLLWTAGRVLGEGRRLAGKSPPPSCEREFADIWTGTFGPAPDHAARAATDRGTSDAS